MASSSRGSIDGGHPGSATHGYHGLKRTLSSASRNSAAFSFMTSSKNNEPQKKEYRIVVYDSLEKKVWVDTEENVEKTGKFVKVPIRGTDTKVAVWMEIGPRDEKAKVYIATVDLGVLGKWVKTQRRKSKMQHLYVLGRTPKGLEPVEEETIATV